MKDDFKKHYEKKQKLGMETCKRMQSSYFLNSLKASPRRF